MRLKGILLALCLGCSGCAGVIPLPKRTHTPQGTQENVQLDFIHVGQSNRAEVLDKLKPFDTGVNSERFFVGRWTSSTWAWFVVTNNAGAGDRHWGTKNLLLEFDEKGLVKKSEIFSDKDLIRELGPVVEDYKVAESADRMEIMVAPSYLESASSRIILSGGSIEFDGVGPRKRGRHFTIPASKVSRIESVNARGADPLYTAQVIHFSENLKTFGGPPRNKIFVRIKMPDLVALLQYVKTNGGH